MFRRLTQSILSVVPSQGSEALNSEPGLRRLVMKVAQAPGFVEMCAIFGYDAEEHIVRTSDGYLLGIHRIGGPKGSNWRQRTNACKNCWGVEGFEESVGAGSRRSSTNTTASSPDSPDQNSNGNGNNSFKRPVVYLHHGLMMNSEVWVSVTDASKSLPFVLADMGYDVWLGNNRGNKYSKKHVFRNPSDREFWDFCIDDFALYDIPDTVDYILNVVKQDDLTYIGFSQGSAQGFASLSINPTLNSKIRLFVALAPAMAPPGLGNRIVDSLVRASPSIIYLFFGRQALLKSTTFWQSIMFPPLFVRTIDAALRLLFNWQAKNITYAQKLAAYSHLYSYTSVKSVVHWFQIIRSARFHMYDDEIYNPLVETYHENSFYRVAPFPTQNIVAPIVLIYGKSDSLVSINAMLAELPTATAHVGISHYEHLDLIWADSVDTLVFPYIFSALRRTGTATLALPASPYPQSKQLQRRKSQDLRHKSKPLPISHHTHRHQSQSGSIRQMSNSTSYLPPLTSPTRQKSPPVGVFFKPSTSPTSAASLRPSQTALSDSESDIVEKLSEELYTNI
ncbi:Tgl1p [Sugiyamaella lignohabitans]|uniref:Tgl1p n=1 Tax=Sugiyamaella lignohabitans TaxID=796027 RepID=A0A167DQM1_9ASCO|nr:Tgl1p [Sugiyamaella lignohabitans]ANB13175.1 Tgl1p [Sugiyamaella lignohabitans]